jgi:hypothetical protein
MPASCAHEALLLTVNIQINGEENVWKYMQRWRTSNGGMVMDSSKHTDRLFGTRSVVDVSIALQRTYADGGKKKKRSEGEEAIRFKKLSKRQEKKSVPTLPRQRRLNPILSPRQLILHSRFMLAAARALRTHNSVFQKTRPRRSSRMRPGQVYRC